MSEELLKAAISKNTQEFAKIFREELFANMKKEEPTMQVSYNGFIGELVKLERKVIDPKSLYIDSIPIKFADSYELQIFTPDNGGIVSFTGVKPQGIKILGGVVTFDG